MSDDEEDENNGEDISDAEEDDEDDVQIPEKAITEKNKKATPLSNVIEKLPRADWKVCLYKELIYLNLI